MTLRGSNDLGYLTIDPLTPFRPCPISTIVSKSPETAFLSDLAAVFAVLVSLFIFAINLRRNSLCAKIHTRKAGCTFLGTYRYNLRIVFPVSQFGADIQHSFQQIVKVRFAGPVHCRVVIAANFVFPCEVEFDHQPDRPLQRFGGFRRTARTSSRSRFTRPRSFLPEWRVANYISRTAPTSFPR